MPILRKQLKLDDAMPGMVLSDDLLDAQGKILLAKDVALTEATISALRRHGIDAVSIVTGTLSDDELADKRRRFEERLAILFRKPDDDERCATGILKQYVRYYRLGGEDE